MFLLTPPIDKNLSNESDVPGLSTKNLGGIFIEVYKANDNEKVRDNDKKFKSRLKAYDVRIQPPPLIVDDKSYTTQGVAYRAGSVQFFYDPDKYGS